MRVIVAALMFVCVGVSAYPYYPYYASNMDSLAFGSTGSNQGAMVMSRFYQPYYNPRMNAGMSAFMYHPQQQNQQPSNQGYYMPERKPEVQDSYLPSPQQNEVFAPQVPEEAPTTARIELDVTDKVDTKIDTTTLKNIPEIVEPEVEDVEQPAKKVPKRKQVKKPVEEEDDDEFIPKMPSGMMFPMFFGYGGRSAGGAPGITAVANAYSTGRGGVATSHATAYGPPRVEGN